MQSFNDNLQDFKNSPTSSNFATLITKLKLKFRRREVDYVTCEHQLQPTNHSFLGNADLDPFWKPKIIFDIKIHESTESTRIKNTLQKKSPRGLLKVLKDYLYTVFIMVINKFHAFRVSQHMSRKNLTPKQETSLFILMFVPAIFAEIL